MKLTNKEKELAKNLNDYGFSQVKIANLMDVTQSTISKAIKEIKTDTNLNIPINPFEFLDKK